MHLITHLVLTSLTIASNDLEVGVLLLDVFDHIDLEDGISLGRVLEQEVLAIPWCGKSPVEPHPTYIIAYQNHHIHTGEGQ